MATVFLSPTAHVKAENTCSAGTYTHTHKNTHMHTAPMDTAHVILSTHGNSGEEAASSMQTETGEALFGSATVNKEQPI